MDYFKIILGVSIGACIPLIIGLIIGIYKGIRKNDWELLQLTLIALIYPIIVNILSFLYFIG